MTLFFADLVREYSYHSGAGDFVLGGAIPGHRRFAEAVPAGARFHYSIAGVTRPREWEVGEGEIGSGGLLVRMPVASSADGALVDFSAGLKTVALTVAASWFAAQEQATTIDDVAGLEAALADKAEADHGHDQAEVAGLSEALAAKAPLVSPTLSGTPTAPTAPGTTNNGQIATTAFVHALIDALLGAAPAALDTLKELADAIGDDADFAGTVTNALAARLARAMNLSDLSDPAAARANLGLGTAAIRDVGTSGAKVPLLNGTNNWSADQNVLGGIINAANSGIDGNLQEVIRMQWAAFPGVDHWRHSLLSAVSTTPTGSMLRFALANGEATQANVLDLRGDQRAVFYGSIHLDALPADHVDDAAAAAAGLPIGTLYRNGSQLMVRAS